MEMVTDGCRPCTHERFGVMQVTFDGRSADGKGPMTEPNLSHGALMVRTLAPITLWSRHVEPLIAKIRIRAAPGQSPQLCWRTVGLGGQAA